MRRSAIRKRRGAVRKPAPKLLSVNIQRAQEHRERDPTDGKPKQFFPESQSFQNIQAFADEQRASEQKRLKWAKKVGFADVPAQERL